MAVTFTRANSASGDSDPANQVNKFQPLAPTKVAAMML